MLRFTSAFICVLHLCGVLMYLPGNAQQTKVDMLQQQLLTSKQDTSRANLLSDLAQELCFRGDYEAAQQQAVASLTLSRALQFQAGMARALNHCGTILRSQGNYREALQKHTEALKIAESTGNKKLLATTTQNIGIVYDYEGKYPEALKYYFSALRQFEALGDKRGIASSHNDLGIIYFSQANYTDALNNYELSLKLRTALGDKQGMADLYNNMGNVFWRQHKYELALRYHQTCLGIVIETGNKKSIANSNGNIGNVYFDEGKYTEALGYYKEESTIEESLGDHSGMSTAYGNLALAYANMKRISEAGEYAVKALALAKQTGSLDDLAVAYLGASQVYEILGKEKEALMNYKSYVCTRDSLLNKENTRKSVQQQMQYEFDSKDARTRADQEKKDVRQRLIRYSLSAGFALMVILALVIFRSFRQKQKANELLTSQKQEIAHQKDVIEEKQRETLDSIHYARRIQHAMLTSQKYIEEHVPGCFLFFQPKDIVSGDFYWALNTTTPHGSLFYLATADCTGHGVPGAFMSMLGINFLNEIVIERGITRPHLILDKLRDEIIHALNPEGTSEEAKDGMDAVLCAFDFAAKKLYYAAANNSFYIVRNKQLVICPADKMPVGKYHGEPPSFTAHTVSLEPGDLVYTFTDGFADQFGGPKGKKLKYKSFEEKLLSVSHLPMAEQKKELNTMFQIWKSDYEQVDDVLVIGIRI